jgi:hypothetical protein
MNIPFSLPRNSAYDESTRMLFEKEFPFGVKPEKLYNIIALHLKRVKEVVDTLGRMFATNKVV